HGLGNFGVEFLEEHECTHRRSSLVAVQPVWFFTCFCFGWDVAPRNNNRFLIFAEPAVPNVRSKLLAMGRRVKHMGETKCYARFLCSRVQALSSWSQKPHRLHRLRH